MKRLAPALPPFAAACGATAFLLAYRGAPTAFDEWLALPIGIETASPGTYPAGDLLVQGSVHGPFHLYKLASVLWTLGVDADVAWYVLLALSLVAFFLAVWRLAAAMGLNSAERLMLVAAIAATPIYRGTLNWSAQPMLSFITASVAVPLGLLAIAAALEDHPVRALVFAALTFDVHPSLGLCAGIAVAVVSWRRPVKELATAVLVALLVAAPNLVYLLRHPPGASAASDADLWAIFRIFGYHTFVRDHWRDGYPWYAMALALALVGAAQLGIDAARRARVVVLAMTVVAVGWIGVMNLASLPAVMPLYLIRASLLAKPLLVGLALTALTRRGYAGKYAFLAPWAGVVAVAHPSRVVAEAALAIVLGVVLQPSSDRRLSAVGTAAWTCGALLLLAWIAGSVPALDALMAFTTPLRLAALGVGATAVALLLAPPSDVPGFGRPGRPWAMRSLALALPVLSVGLARPFGRGWLPESRAKISERLHLSRPLPKESGAMDWAAHSSPPGSLFAIPPIDANWLRFRVVTHRGAYVTVHDINQLLYVRDLVFPAVDRLAALGVVVKGPHNFDPRPYLRPTCARLQRLGRDAVGYYVLPVESVVPTGSVISYRDANYTILDVNRTLDACRATSPADGGD